MANVLVDENSLSGIANAIRNKNGTQETYLPSEMAQAILDIPSGGGDVKLFETIAEMQADTGAQEGDLAVVYNQKQEALRNNVQFSKAIFPKNVTLPEPISGETYEAKLLTVENNPDTGIPDETLIYLDETMFGFDCPIGSAFYHVEYMSEDGQNYQRNDEMPPLPYDTRTGFVDFEHLLKVDNESTPTIDTNIGYFIEITDGDFQGIFEYTKKRDESKLGFLDISSISFDVDMDNLMIVNINNTNDYYNFDVESNATVIQTLYKEACVDYINRTGAIIDYTMYGTLYFKNNSLKLLLVRDTVQNKYQTHDISIAYNENKQPVGLYIAPSQSKRWEVSTYTFDLANQTINYDGVIELDRGYSICFDYIPDTYGLRIEGTCSIPGDVSSLTNIRFTNNDTISTYIAAMYLIDPEYPDYGYDIITEFFEYYLHIKRLGYYHALSQLTLTNQSELLLNLIAYGREGLIVGTKESSGGGEPNIFMQIQAPETKQGIWLQKEATPEHYTYDEEVFIGGNWKAIGIEPDLPVNGLYNAIAIGTDIYLFGEYYNTAYSSINVAYKYDTLTRTYTQLTNVPYACARCALVSIGTDIYLFGSSNNSSSTLYTAYKYDTLTDTYTQLATSPKPLKDAGASVVGTDIYLFGGSTSGWAANAFKYDTLTNTYTQISDIPEGFPYAEHMTATVGTNIYLFGVSNSYNKVYKYDTLTGTYTQLMGLQYAFQNGSVSVVGTDIYLFGGNSSGGYTNADKYNTLTNAYTGLIAIPEAFYQYSSVAVGTDIYLMGAVNNQHVQVYALESKTYEQDNLVVINQGRYNDVGYEIELYSNPKDVLAPKYAFADAYYYTIQGGLETNIPTYYGDGTQWIKIKN